MGKLTVKYVSPLGEYDQKFGQRYYGKAHDTDMDISFNLMNPVNFDDGDEIEFEEKVIKEKGPKSKNPGEEYLFLKKVKRANSGSQEVVGVGAPKTGPSSTATQAKQNPASAVGQELSYEAGTNARWSLKLAVDTYKSVVGGMPDSKQDYEQITKFARWLLQAFTDLKSPKPEEEPVSDGSGLAHARAKADEIRGRSTPMTTEEANEFLGGLEEEPVEEGELE